MVRDLEKVIVAGVSHHQPWRETQFAQRRQGSPGWPLPDALRQVVPKHLVGCFPIERKPTHCCPARRNKIWATQTARLVDNAEGYFHIPSNDALLSEPLQPLLEPGARVLPDG